MKQKLFSLVLAILFSITFINYSFADATQISCNLADAVEWSADQWISTPENRAFLTVLFLFEMGTNKTISVSDYYVSDSVVCKSDDILTIGVCGKKDSIMIFYRPSISYASYLEMKQYSLDTLERSLESLCEIVYVNSKDAIQDALQFLESYYNTERGF